MHIWVFPQSLNESRCLICYWQTWDSSHHREKKHFRCDALYTLSFPFITSLMMRWETPLLILTKCRRGYFWPNNELPYIKKYWERNRYAGNNTQIVSLPGGALKVFHVPSCYEKLVVYWVLNHGQFAVPRCFFWSIANFWLHILGPNFTQNSCFNQLIFTTPLV